MKLFTLPFLLGLISPVMAQQAEPQTATSLPVTKQTIESKKTEPKITAQQWLERMSFAMRNLNFSTSFVVVKENRAEPYRWFHGVEDGNELEVLVLLNGPRFEVVRKQNVVSYFEPNKPAYSVAGKTISGPIPAAFSDGIEALQVSYNFVSVGRSRILGRPARLIRLVAKDAHRYGYWLWLDEQSGLLLKAALINRQGNFLEQLQFTHLDITKTPADALVQLKQSKMPAVIDVPKAQQNAQFDWRATWLPAGFEVKNSNRHRVGSSEQDADFISFNDGLVDVSIYVSKVKQKSRAIEATQEGATTLSTLR